jgi:hypothetical protein
MTKEELKQLFKKYLNRLFTDSELLIHGDKNYEDFEVELFRCDEHNNPKGGILDNKKIAIVLSGHIRNRSTIQSLNDICNRYNIDVFIHTWDNIGVKGNETNMGDPVNLGLVQNTINSIINVKNYKIENNANFLTKIKNETENNLYFNYSSPEIFIKSQLYSVQESFKLLENYSIDKNIKYDCVIKLRFDVSFTSFTLDNRLVDEMNNNDIIFVTNPEEHYHADYGSSCWACDNMYYKFGLTSVHYFEHTNVICDLFAYGSQKSMKVYCHSYDDYDNINKSFIENNLKIIEDKKLSVEKIGNSYQFFPKGQDGHLETLYYVDCSYPERILQKRLKNFMVLKTEKIKIKFNR